MSDPHTHEDTVMHPEDSHLQHGLHIPYPHMPHIGMRKTKSVLAVFVAFWIWQLVRVFLPELEVHPIYIYIYGLIEIRETSEKTVDLGKSRIRATFTALGVGLPILALSELLKAQFEPRWAHIAVELTLLLAGVLLTLIVAEKVHCKTYCGLAAAIFIILMVSHTNDERYLYAILRAFQTVAGVLVAWVINVKLLPYPKRPRKRKAPSEAQSGS